MSQNISSIEDFDPELWNAISSEEVRQEEHIELIASENYTSKRILIAQGSVLTNNMPKAILERDIMGVVRTLT